MRENAGKFDPGGRPRIVGIRSRNISARTPQESPRPGKKMRRALIRLCLHPRACGSNRNLKVTDVGYFPSPARVREQLHHHQHSTSTATATATATSTSTTSQPASQPPAPPPAAAPRSTTARRRALSNNLTTS